MEDDIDSACSTYGDDQMCIQNFNRELCMKETAWEALHVLGRPTRGRLVNTKA